MRTQRLSLVASVTLALLLLASCKSSSPSESTSTAMVPAPKSVFISTGNGGGMVVYLPSDNPDQPVMLCTSGAEICPECTKSAIKYFKTGVVDPKCPMCGATHTVATEVPPTPYVGHN